MPLTFQHSTRQANRRPGLAMMEVVMDTAVSLPVAAALFWLGQSACKNLFSVIGLLVGWPYM